MGRSKTFTFIYQSINVLKFLVLLLWISFSAFFLVFQLFFSEAYVETSSMEVEECVEYTDGTKECKTIIEDDSEKDYAVTKVWISNTTTGVIYILAFGLLTFGIFKISDIAKDYSINGFFTDKNVNNFRLIGFILVGVPLFYSIAKWITFILFDKFYSNNVVLHGLVRGFHNVELLQFNLSTLILGVLTLLLVEVIKEGISYKTDSDLTI